MRVIGWVNQSGRRQSRFKTGTTRSLKDLLRQANRGVEERLTGIDKGPAIAGPTNSKGLPRRHVVGGALLRRESRG